MILVEAIDDVTAMVVTREVLQNSLGQGSWLGAIVIALAERFRDVDEQLQEEKVRAAP